MSNSLRLSVPDLTASDLAAPGGAASFFRVADAARAADGYDPLNEQARIDLDAGRRSPVLLSRGDAALGAAILGQGELDLVVHPEHRRCGYGTVLLEGILPAAPDTLLAWSHGDHPAARALAAGHGFEAVRTLLQLRLSPLPETTPPPATAAETEPASGTTIDSFRPGTDEAEWIALNAGIFAGHPEQGTVTFDDLRDRESEPWFEAGDFLVARDTSGRMIGYNWLKIEDPPPGQTHTAQTRTGEIYVIGVDATAAGRGQGRALMRAGLARLRGRGCTAATLYVEADNPGAVHLYRSLGFADHTIDVQYRRHAAAEL